MSLLRIVLFLLFTSVALLAKIYDKSAEIAGMTVRYKVALPQDYDPNKTYPAVLAFPPGSQTQDMVQFTMMENWWPQVDRRGYIVVIPEAPGGRMFVGEGARIFPEFLEQLLGEYKIRDRKFHIAGMSNGGRSAFHIAAMYPQYFLSVTGLPGYLPDATPERIQALAKMCIYMHAGELDSSWVASMQQQADEFRGKGYAVHFTIEKGEGHVMSTLAGARSARLYDQIEQSRNGCGK
jgi:predicted esterase